VLDGELVHRVEDVVAAAAELGLGMQLRILRLVIAGFGIFQRTVLGFTGVQLDRSVARLAVQGALGGGAGYGVADIARYPMLSLGRRGKTAMLAQAGIELDCAAGNADGRMATAAVVERGAVGRLEGQRPFGLEYRVLERQRVHRAFPALYLALMAFAAGLGLFKIFRGQFAVGLDRQIRRFASRRRAFCHLHGFRRSLRAGGIHQGGGQAGKQAKHQHETGFCTHMFLSLFDEALWQHAGCHLTLNWLRLCPY
jgi:hypothetical protein